MNVNPSETEKAGQEYNLFTNDQQLFKIATQVTWWKPEERRMFFPILGGMHTLRSFIGCIGTLMANPGLSDILKSSLGGIDKMLKRKNFPQNT